MKFFLVFILILFFSLLGQTEEGGLRLGLYAGTAQVESGQSSVKGFHFSQPSLGGTFIGGSFHQFERGSKNVIMNVYAKPFLEVRVGLGYGFIIDDNGAGFELVHADLGYEFSSGIASLVPLIQWDYSNSRQTMIYGALLSFSI